MEIVTLLSRAHQAGIQFWLQEGALKYKAPAGAFTEELKAEISANKQAVIQFLERQKGNDRTANQIGRASRNEPLPLSYGQKWLWLAGQMNAQSYAFHIPAAFRIRGELSYEVLDKSLNKVIQRHEILRTVYQDTKGEVFQRILPELKLDIPVTDLTETLEEEKEQKVLEELEREMQLPFSLTEGPLFRVTLLRLAAEEFVLLLIFHHIVCDNQSMNLFLSELTHFYTMYAEHSEEEADIAELPVQYADYALWQKNRLEGGIKEQNLSYWKEKLQGIQEIPEIQGDYSRPDVISVRSIREHYTMPAQLADRLKGIGQVQGCSFYVTLLSIFKLLLFQYAGIRDLLIGSPVAGRGQEELQQLIGLFFNTVVIRSKISETDSFTAYMKSVKEAAEGAFANQEIPFELLTEELHIPKQPNKTPIFQILFNMYQTSYKGTLPKASLEVLSKDLIGGQNLNSKFDITLLAIEHEEGMQLDFSFKADLYTERTVHWLVEHFKVLTVSIAEHPECILGKLPGLEPLPVQAAVIPHAYLPFQKEDTEQSILSRFDRQAALYPDRTAVEMQNEKLTYQELRQISVRLGREIRDRVISLPRLSGKEKTRYARQIILDGWGIESQEKLKGLTVFAAGAGGSGSPVIMQLALLGVGKIILCDFDEVELSNLNRQALHDESRIGMNKAESAALTVHRMNPHVQTVVVKDKISFDNVHKLVGGAAIIFDNVDNIEAKFALSECAVANRIPHVISSMIERSAYAAIFHTPYTPCFQCCYDYKKMNTAREFRKRGSGFEKAANSVSSPALFLSAGFAVSEVLKIVLGFENPAYNKFFFFNNQASVRLAQTRGYQIVSYPFSSHFMKTCRENGFDWEKGYTGRIVEELVMRRDPNCRLCSRIPEEADVQEDSASGMGMPKQKMTYENEDPDIVALLIHHSIAMVAGIISTLRSGCAFVPLDPEYPRERLRFILEDTNVHCIVCDEANEALAEEVADSVNPNIQIVTIRNVLKGKEQEEIAEPLPGNLPNADSLAYVLYTSGSMGQPKGVMQTHRNVLHYIRNYTNGLHIGSDDRLSLIPSFIFSAAMMDVFAALSNGAALCLYDFKKKGPGKLGKWMCDNNISVYHSVPTVFRHFTAAIEEGMEFPKLRVIDFGGEVVSKLDIVLYRRHFSPDCILVNGLGATELNVIRQYIMDKKTEITGSTVPVGYPVEDTQILLMDEAGQVLGYNQPGEIVIHSEYLSPGYWGLEGQAEHAVHSFHTGDLGTIRPDGCLEHLGRRDLQIKIRGIRIEPMEIESRLLEIAGIDEAVVVVKEGGNASRHLAAYLVASGKLDSQGIRAELKTALPSYMIPSYLTRISRMPLTATGKINRKALAELQGETEAGTKNMEPENEMQALLVTIWKSVLGVRELGILDNFLDLGGDSIKAIKINSELVQYGYMLKVQDIIETQNIKELSERVTAADEEKTEEEETEAPLTPTQIDYFDFNHHEEINLWNIATILYKKNGYQESLLKDTIDRIVAQHDALRVVFKSENGKRRQYCRSIRAENLYGFSYYDMTDQENARDLISAEADRIQKKNHLEHGPLMQTALFRTKDSDYLLIAIYHMVCDFISANILIQDFCKTYCQLETGEKAEFPIKTASFLNWARSVHQEAASKEMLRGLDYWMKISQTPIPTIPTDFVCAKRLQKDRLEINRKLDAVRTAKIMNAVQTKYQVSAEVILLTVLGQAMKRWCEIPLLRVDFAVNGRTGGYGGLDVSRTVGWFAAAIPVLVETSSENPAENLQRMKETRNGVVGNASDYYILRNITLPEYYPEQTLHSPKEIYLNYFGNRSTSDAVNQMDENAGISDIPVGDCISQEADAGHKLGLVLSVTDGEFCFTLQFSKTEYRQESMEKLLSLYFEEFLKLERSV